MEPKDRTTNEAYKGFTNVECPFMPCHAGVRRQFNCLFCYCPLYAYECLGPYKLFTDSNGARRKDCSGCKLPHDGIETSWKFIQHSMKKLVIWDGSPREERRRSPNDPVADDAAPGSQNG